MINEERLVEFCEQCARSYCGRHNAWSQYDDAVGEACLYLLKHRNKWWKPNQVLQARVVGELVRQYQNEHGLRRKNRLKRVDYNIELVNDRKQPTTTIRNDDERILIIRRALQQPDVIPFADVIVEILNVENSKGDVAKKFGISRARVSQLYKKFKVVCRRLDANTSVAIVDTTTIQPTDNERIKLPLFFQNNE